MTEGTIYRMVEPSHWGTPPTLFSFSSVDAIETCPLQWQLVHASYGDLPQFPLLSHPAAVEGEIIHLGLDLLFKGLAMAGLPAMNSPAFRAKVAALNVPRMVAERVAAYDARVAAHPRGGGSRLRVSTQQLVNRIIYLFRAEYSQAIAPEGSALPSTLAAVPEGLRGEALLARLRMQGALSELRLRHPSLPFVGIIDLVRWTGDGVVLVDFKTGMPKSVHQQQLTLYAVLWWRQTGHVPATLEVRYPSHMVTFAVSADDLHSAEEELRVRIDALTTLLAHPPSAPRPGDQCRYCEVRPFCNTYWAYELSELPIPHEQQRERKPIDIELTVCGQPSAYGFEALARNGRPCTVVYAADGWKIHGPFTKGESLRILNARLTENGEALELMPWTEVFHR